ncbi:MAG: DUF1697 domain-containing protein [Candidatus Pacebacteria bacterium]|nr:DUF1697 domain-containing protein [Candidatus Paceibacterota bacterium]MCF7857473.1 DUF1697 domain-containing protein [Candidatus Paceibacterota bacterium]
MKTCIALLRGINVGGNNKIEMLKLKKCFELLGYTNILTYINTGNVIFETDKDTKKFIKAKVEKGIYESFGLKISAVVRDSKNIKELCKKIPKNWSNDTEQKTDILFLQDGFDTKKTLSLITINPDVDTLMYVQRAIVWNIPRNGYVKSGMHKFIGSKVYKNMTARNVNTVRKLAKLMER